MKYGLVRGVPAAAGLLFLAVIMTSFMAMIVLLAILLFVFSFLKGREQKLLEPRIYLTGEPPHSHEQSRTEHEHCTCSDPHDAAGDRRGSKDRQASSSGKERGIPDERDGSGKKDP